MRNSSEMKLSIDTGYWYVKKGLNFQDRHCITADSHKILDFDKKNKNSWYIILGFHYYGRVEICLSSEMLGILE